MIRGRVNAKLEATVSVKIVDGNGEPYTVEAVVDTGFNGFLTLPRALVSSLNLPLLCFGRARLADGTEKLLATYTGSVVWDRKSREIEVNQTESQPLVGMGLMEGYQLDIEVMDHGRVAIKRLPPKKTRTKPKKKRKKTAAKKPKKPTRQ